MSDDIEKDYQTYESVTLKICNSFGKYLININIKYNPWLKIITVYRHTVDECRQTLVNVLQGC